MSPRFVVEDNAAINVPADAVIEYVVEDVKLIATRLFDVHLLPAFIGR